jgi:hypothetical protein
MAGKHASAIDAESMTVTMDGDPLEDDQISKARLTVCANVDNAEEATELMMMLGIHPSQEKEAVSTLGPNNLPNNSPNNAPAR